MALRCAARGLAAQGKVLFRFRTQHLPLNARKRALGDVLGYLRDAPDGADSRTNYGIAWASSERNHVDTPALRGNYLTGKL
jgi:hypothetical protein